MSPTPRTLLRATLLAASVGLLAACSSMDSMSSAPKSRVETYTATLSGAAEVPPNASTGTGMAEVQVDADTYKLTYKVSYSALSGPATMGHIHGPAAAGANAGVVVPFKAGEGSTFMGEAQLTPAQYADLAAGLYYVNVHTAKSPGGEVRGQLKK